MERRKIREIIIKALYRMDIGGDNPVEIVENFTKRAKISAENKELGLKWIKKIIQKKEEIDEIIERIAKNWSLNRIAIIDKQILRLGVCELLWFKDIPFRVSINEAVELAKKYSEEEGYKFVNGILDKVAKDENRNNK
jgi:N utilization substance protein B